MSGLRAANVQIEAVSVGAHCPRSVIRFSDVAADRKLDKARWTAGLARTGCGWRRVEEALSRRHRKRRAYISVCSPCAPIKHATPGAWLTTPRPPSYRQLLGSVSDKRRLCSRAHLSSIARVFSRSASEAGRSVAGRQIASQVGRTEMHAVEINPVNAATPDLYLADSGVTFCNAPYGLV